VFSLLKMDNRTRSCWWVIFSSSISTTYASIKGNSNFLWCLYLSEISNLSRLDMTTLL
jgi:hypothetical protein